MNIIFKNIIKILNKLCYFFLPIENTLILRNDYINNNYNYIN